MTDEPWLTEPDHEEFTAHSLQCVVHRVEPFKHLCGYVGVPASHPLYGTHTSDVVPYPDAWKKERVDIDEVGAINLFLHAVSHEEVPAGHAPIVFVLKVHGGLTWADHADWLPFPDLWFFGFDCTHAGDYQPGLFNMMQGIRTPLREDEVRRYSTYRTFDYVKGECVHLAEQLADYRAQCDFIQKLTKEKHDEQ